VALLRVRGLARSFYGVHAVRRVDLDVEAGRITGLIGPNGAGKTTVFNCISGVVPPDSGSIVFEARDITGWRPDRVTKAGLVRTFQIARGFPQLTVLENLLLYGPGQSGERVLPALFSRSRVAREEDALREHAFSVARRLNLLPVVNNLAAELSGGQKKLLEIGRALMGRPKLILLDEPVAGVNPALAKEIEGQLRGLVAEGMSILLIEHHMDTVAQLCDRVIVLAEGANLAEGGFAEVANDPRVQEAYMGRRRWAA
jgi:ABC-type branched-subunit amino acid transport system ATPase component